MQLFALRLQTDKGLIYSKPLNNALSWEEKPTQSAQDFDDSHNYWEKQRK